MNFAEDEAFSIRGTLQAGKSIYKFALLQEQGRQQTLKGLIIETLPHIG